VLYRCYAKLNVTLEVLRRREDGFHDLASLAHTINLADDLRIQPANEILSRVEGLEAIEDNLVTRAAYLLASTTSTRLGAELTLVKRIPAAAGLGGGSSDAATTLVGLNSLWQCRLGYHALERLALQLGSDVPYFVRGGAAIIGGRGEALEPVPPLREQWFAVVVPALSLHHKTATLYGALQPTDFSSGTRTRAAAGHLKHGQPLDDSLPVNAFTRAAREVFPGLTDIWRSLEQRCGRPFHLSGAGPALFALADNRADANRLAKEGQALGATGLAARSVHRARASIRGRRIEYP
jgi:4-diphosphocytidyl-2-C-methyl-D-erythritol kinase